MLNTAVKRLWKRVEQVAFVYVAGRDDTTSLAGGVWSNNCLEDSSPGLY